MERKMKKFMILLATGLLATACAANEEMAKPMANNMSHAHIGHVLNKWKDTPDNSGFLPTARAEAEIAIKHAGAAAKKPTDLNWMKKHTKHVIHAVDPEKITKGPGLGYGVLKAAKGVAKHITLSAKSDNASDNIKKHAIHVNMTANNTTNRAAEILVHADKVLQATSASDAAPHVTVMSDLANQLLQGKDANGNGKISWHEGEGGLLVAEKHMGAMVKMEGI